MKQEFSTRLYTSGNWLCAAIPFAVEQVFGVIGRIAVCGRLNQMEFRSSLFPNGDGTHFMLVNQDMQKGTGLKAGDLAKIELERDSETRKVKLPEDFSAFLDRQPEVKKIFERFSYSHQREWVNYITEAKKSETRQRRMEKVVQDIMEKSRD